MEFKLYKPPEEGELIQFKEGKPITPDNPIICRIRGDGIGVDISPAAEIVFNAAVERAYGGKRKVVWFDLLAGEEAIAKGLDPLPQETIDAISYFKVAIKGPLTTPVGGGYRSLNVTLRQVLDLYCCVRPVRYYPGVPSPMKRPDLLNIVVFRENTEDVYAGIEWAKDTPEAKKVIEFLKNEMNVKVRNDSGIGIKPISEYASKRLVRAAINYAIKHNRKSVTLVHKGNIMKYTEGAFREWGYEVAKDEFSGITVTEKEIKDGASAEGKIVIKDRIADAMFQQLLLRPNEYDVIATPNLNGDYVSDACAAQVGGLGMAPGANINYENGKAIFEATHGSAPKHAGKDEVNPSSLILSGAMMFQYLGWTEVSDLIIKGIEGAIKSKKVTYDLARQIEGATKVKCSEFAREIVNNMD